MGDAIEDLFGGLSGGADQVGDAEDDERDDIIDAIIEKKFGKPEEKHRFGRRKEKKQEVFQNPMARAGDSDEDSEGETEKPKPKRDEDPEEALRQKLQALSPAQLEKAAQIAGVDIRALEAASRTECCGFSLSQRVFVATSTIMPVADAWTDWALIIEWLYKLLYPSADCSVCASSGGSGSFDSGCTSTPGPDCPQLTWLLAGLVIQVLSGAVSGGLLASGSLSKRCGGCGCLVAFAGGMLGVAPMLEAAVTLSDGMHHSTDDQLAEDIWLLKSIRALELVVETLPQSFLQVSIGVMYGMLSPTSLQFDPLLALSVTISLVTAGVTMVGMCGAPSLGRSLALRLLTMHLRNRETMGRNAELADDLPPLGLATKYGFATAAWRSCQTMMLLCCASLYSCAAPVFGMSLVFVVVSCWLFGQSMWESAFQR